MKVFGIVGWKNSGKTTLVLRLVELLSAAGLRVATIKHAHHAFDTDKPGTDSYRHRKAGARQVIVASKHRWVHICEKEDEAEPSLDQLLAKLLSVDLVLVEGFKKENHPKLQVVRADTSIDPMPEQVDNLVAIATDNLKGSVTDSRKCKEFDLNDAPAIAKFILSYLGIETELQ